MSRMTVYISILATVLLGAHLMGLVEDTGSVTLLQWVTNPEDFRADGIFDNFISVLTLISAAGAIITAGLAISQKYDLALLVGVTDIFFLVGWDMLAIYNGIKEINPDVAILLISPLLLVYFLTVIEWWRGTG